MQHHLLNREILGRSSGALKSKGAMVRKLIAGVIADPTPSGVMPAGSKSALLGSPGSDTLSVLALITTRPASEMVKEPGNDLVVELDRVGIVVVDIQARSG